MPLIAYPTVRVMFAQRRPLNRSRPWRAQVQSYHFSVDAALREAAKVKQMWIRVWLEAVKEGVATNGKVRRQWR